MAVNKLTEARYIGKVCQFHPEFNGIRDKGSRACIQCRSENRIMYRLTHPEKDIEAAKRWRDKHRADLNAKQRARNAANPEIPLQYAMIRAMEKMKRVPPWADTRKLAEVYKNCPLGMVVDHIVPLRGEKVSGFHVDYNLQYLTPQENSAKGNKFEVQ